MKWKDLFTVVLCLGSTLGGNASAITLHQTGYTATPIASLYLSSSGNPSDIELDAAGNLYIPAQPGGIFRVTPEGVISPWSNSSAVDLTFTPSGDGYGAGGTQCPCIDYLGSDGSYGSITNGLQWSWVELSPVGTLYASVTGAVPEVGLYTIDRNTGYATGLIVGPPGPRYYRGMTFGPDGKLYLIGGDDTGDWLWRLDGASLTKVAALPHSGIGLTVDPSGVFYTATSFGSFAEVWSISGSTATLLASDLTYPSGIAFDAARGRLYVVEQFGLRQVWSITKDVATPTRKTTWGDLKSLYR